jgi:hypothetical protein
MGGKKKLATKASRTCQPCIVQQTIDAQYGADVSHNRVGIAQAQYADIPVPLNTVPAQFVQNFKSDQYDKGECTLLAYESTLNVKQLVAFYVQHMEILDWQQTHSFCAAHTLLVFEKPGKTCAIYVQPYSKKVVRVLYFITHID